MKKALNIQVKVENILFCRQEVAKSAPKQNILPPFASFTLAEVLITLVIIGVIAAITIPNLMQSWRKHERITQIKQAYSIVSNAVKISIAENGSPDGWSYTDSTSFAEQYIIPYLKVETKCGLSITDKRCFTKGYWYWMNGTAATSTSGYECNQYYKIKLQNGMGLGIWARPGLNGNKVEIAVDVNGSKGSTTAGDDIFWFTFDPKNNSPVSTLKSTGNNKDVNIMLTDNKTDACNKAEVSRSGRACARLLEINNWEFPDNYPIKIK